MQPIAQTFIVNEPATGVDTLLLTSVDLYFNSVSPTYGVEVQIRTTLNGYPTQYVLPHGSVVVDPIANPGILVSSGNATLGSRFTFPTPVIISANTQYAIVVIPVGGNPAYTIWTAAIGDNDATSGAPIYTNNQSGTLFISSNDLNFTPVQNESMKFTLRTAQFTTTSGNAVFRNSNTDYIVYGSVVGSFQPGEVVYPANNLISLASLTVTGASGFANGQIVVQPNTAAATSTANAYGTVVFANATTLFLANVVGSFTNTSGLRNITGTGNTPAPTTVNQNANIALGSNTLNLPHTVTTDLATNNMIFISSSSLSNAQVLFVTSNNSTNTTATSVTLSGNATFSAASSSVGRIYGDGNTYSFFSTSTPFNIAYNLGVFDGVVATPTINFANISGKYLIGSTSGTTALARRTVNPLYEAITSTLVTTIPNQTNAQVSFLGTAAASNTLDSNSQSISIGTPYEFVDEARVIFSRSNELTYQNSNSTFKITSNITTSNTLVAPVIDAIGNSVRLNHNRIVSTNSISGYILSVSNANGLFFSGDTIWHNPGTANVQAKILSANSSRILAVTLTSSNSAQQYYYNVNSTAIITDSNTGTVANLVGATPYSEALGNGIDISRYISKNAILADQQDAEDLITYITAYRPPGGDFAVYGKVIAGSDYDSFTNKHWSVMTPTYLASTLYSSLVNRNDYIELQYNLPSSNVIVTSGANCTNSSTTINLPTTFPSSLFSPGQFIYVQDATWPGGNSQLFAPTTAAFNVRQIMSIPNTSAIVVNANTSVNLTNAAVGVIPGLQSQAGAFKFSNNYGIVRYATSADAVYDTFKTFAIKVVPTTNSTQIIPRMADLRCLALQV